MKINNIPMSHKEFAAVLVDAKIAIREKVPMRVYEDSYDVYTESIFEDPFLDFDDNDYCITTVTHNCTSGEEHIGEFRPHHCW